MALARRAHAGRRVAAALALVAVVLGAGGCGPSAVGSSPSAAITGGCSPARPLPTGTTRRQLRFDGSARSYLLHIPPAYNGVRRLPVVVTFHGLGDSAEEQLAASSFAAVANRDGFVVVAPESRGPGWDLAPPSRPGSDAAFVVALMHDLTSVACVDPRLRYATGFSSGAAEVFALACANAGGFAAYGGVAGVFYVPTCDRAPAQPIVYFHGTADPVVPIDGEVVSGVTIGPTRQYLADWAAHNGCSAVPHQSAVALDVMLVTWSGCRDDANVDFYIIAGGGHSWPGAPRAIVRYAGLFSGHTTESISASQITWHFFAQRSR